MEWKTISFSRIIWVKKPGSKTVTVAARGVFREDDALQERFFRMLRM